MPFFPQLSTGAASQYPLRRRQGFRAAVNRMADGSQIQTLDPGVATVEVEMELNGLTDAEIGGIEAFYAEQEGRLRTFGFLDPAYNMLQWSEDFSKPAWTCGATLALSGGVADPWGMQRATRIANGAPVGQTVLQTIGAPGGYQYCFSLWLRSGVPGAVTLLAQSGAAAQAWAVGMDAVWRRVWMSVRLPAAGDSIAFGFEVPADATIEAAGAQVDPQPAPAGYRRSTARSGVYAKARFSEDSFTRVTRGENNHSTTIRILTSAA